MKINGVEFEFDGSDYVVMEKIEKLQTEIDNKIAEINKLKPGSEQMKASVKMYSDMFIDITGADVLNGVTSLGKATETFYDFVKQAAAECKKIAEKKYDIKQVW